MFGQVARILWGDWPSAMPKPSKDPELPKPKSTGGRLHVARWSVCASIYPHVLRMHQLWSSIPNISDDATNFLFAKLLNEAAWFVKLSYVEIPLSLTAELTYHYQVSKRAWTDETFRRALRHSAEYLRAIITRRPRSPTCGYPFLPRSHCHGFERLRCKSRS